jgi:predicted XRE-type DNA-binding protein
MAKDSGVERSSGNVFADLGIASPDQYLAKAELTAQLLKVIRNRRLTQVETAKRLGITQPKVSALVNGRLDGFSTERLMRFLNVLGCDVRISVSAPHPRKPGSIQVLAG